MMARYLGCSASDVALRVGPHGKPELAAPGQSLQFNVAHSGPLLLAAFGRGPGLGVDIERMPEAWPLEGLDAGVLSPAEMQVLAQASPRDRQDQFLAYWVRKEAVLKAEGSGMMVYPPSAVSVVPAGASPSITVRCGDALYTVVDISIDEEYRGALAIASPGRAPWVRCYRFG